MSATRGSVRSRCRAGRRRLAGPRWQLPCCCRRRCPVCRLRFRPLAADADGHRRGRSRCRSTCCSGRPACCRSATPSTSASAATRPSTLMRAINDGLPLPMRAGAARRARVARTARSALLFGAVTTRQRRHDLRDDHARHRRAGVCRDVHAAELLRRRGGHHRRAARAARRCSASARLAAPGRTT